jgi:hypothetical protein
MLLRVLKALSRAERVSANANRPMMVSSTTMGLDIGILHFLHKLSWLWGAKTSTALSSHAKVVREAVSDYRDVSERSYREYLVAVQTGENATFDFNEFKGQPFVKEKDLVAVAEYSNATSMSLIGDGLGENGFANLMRSFGNRDNLKEIYISENPQVNLNAPAIGFNGVELKIPALPSLESFKANGCSISGKSLNFFDALPEGLKTLHLNRVTGLEGAIDQLCDFLKKSSISSLCIEGCNLPDASMKKILEALKDKHLEELRIGGNKLDFYSYPLLKELVEYRLPKAFDLSGVCDDGLINQYLRFTPENLTDVEYLNLANNGLTAEHVLKMFEGFKYTKGATIPGAYPGMFTSPESIIGATLTRAYTDTSQDFESIEGATKKRGKGRPRKQEKEEKEEKEEIAPLPNKEVKAPLKVNESLELDLSDNKLESNCYPALKNISNWTEDFTVELSPYVYQFADFKEFISGLGENNGRKIKINLSSSHFLPWQGIVLQKYAPENVKVGPAQEAGLITRLEVKMMDFLLNPKEKGNAMARE